MSRQQTAGSPPVAPADGAEGGLIPAALPPATRPGGVGSVGNAARPFRLGGE